MPRPKLTKVELQILEVLWTNAQSLHPRDSGIVSRGAAPGIHHSSNHGVSPGRQEGGAPRPQKISNAHIFEPTVRRDVARHRLLDEILAFFGGRAQPMMAQLAEAGKLTRDDIRELEKSIQKYEEQRKAGGRGRNPNDWRNHESPLAIDDLRSRRRAPSASAFRKSRAEVRSASGSVRR